ncbi:CFI-box-CTERM domain-containing protein [Candidatus Nitrosotenuis aquarius]|uniref:CFI-box-CTERM domain-containing protein n=1 Tax=Candidatus Nitrosotenuis aquarius TaxID=1846278 RepID=UPI0015B2FED9|nr:CFI-box-CTERM domain-containing protein [Candidatus Nitrosotenuis aquarius]
MNVTIILALSIAVLIVNLPDSFAQEFDSESMNLPMPNISMSPISGPPGTEIAITIKNMPPVPEGLDPRIELFAYIPFVTALGDNVANNCNGEHCFPVYSFEEIAADKLAPKTIRFSLFSTDNPKATIQGGFQESVCDVRVNEKTIERYGTVCHTIDQPLGDYEIKFAWGIQSSDKFDIRKTMTFTVTEKGTEIVEGDVENPSEALMDAFEKGEITEEEFDSAMYELGYDDDAIRKSKALLGKLPHQEGDFAPEQQEEILEGIEKAEEQAKEERESEETVVPIVAPPEEHAEVPMLESDEKEEETAAPSGCLIATAAHGTELAPQVQMLREIRDNVLFRTSSGTTFMAGFNEFYYSFSPAIADLERQSPVFREIVKAAITPMLSTMSILSYVDIDSESEILGYGIGMILLNTGIYFVAPALVIIRVRKYFKS